MNPELYQKVCDIFAEAKELPPAARGKYIAAECAGDEDLRREVESLLASDEESGSFIEAPALEVAAEMLAGDQAQTKIGKQIGHYRIVSLLGAGGMGEVWLAEDSRLRRQVALKLLSTVHSADFLLRFEQEAHAVSALNHPNILTIFDIGQSDDWQFIATEFINGKTLRQLIKANSLTIAQTVEIAIQISAALIAAHSAGIVHRDIKPENIMVRADGIVKVLDFGLARIAPKTAANPDAKNITKPGMIMGTVTYMSPEQARGLPVDERTDIFSLGIVLFEMLTGRLPFDGINEIEVLAAILERQPQKLNDKIPARLKNIVEKALHKNPAERITAAQMLDELRQIERRPEAPSENGDCQTEDNLHNLQTIQMTAVTGGNEPPATSDRPVQTSAKSIMRLPQGKVLTAALLVAVLLVAAAGIGIYQYKFKAVAPAVLTDADKLLIADFENKTGDEEFDNILRQPLAVGLAQSPFISLVPDGQIRQTLKSMEKPPDQPLTADIAREICQRRGVKAFLKGTIENYGVKYLITLEAFNAQTGESVARRQIESANKETVVESLDQATTEMRGKLGESLASIKQFDMPLKTSTTSSLEALKAYSLATKSLSDGKTDEGITFLKQAADIDPNFAGTYASLAAAYSNKGQMAFAAEYAAKAFALRDRMTEREKQKISSFYYVFVTGELDKDIENLEAAKVAFPRDNTIPMNLGASYVELGKFTKSEENARLSIKLDPTIFYPYSNLARYLNRQSRFEESKAVYEDALSRKFSSPQIAAGIFSDALAMGDTAEMQKQLAIMREQSKSDAFKLEANAAISSGRTRDYQKLIEQSIAGDADAPDANADSAVQAAVNLAALGKCPEALSWADRALKLDRGYQTLTDATMTNELCGGAPTETMIAELKQRFPKHTVVNSIWLPIIRVAAEIKDSPERALESLEINRQFEGAAYFWDNYLRGKLYLKLNHLDLAESEFQKITQNRGWAVSSPLFPLAHLELARIYKSKNDPENSKKYSDQFAQMWKDSDVKMPL